LAEPYKVGCSLIITQLEQDMAQHRKSHVALAFMDAWQKLVTHAPKGDLHIHMFIDEKCNG
jgi:hypothetical protein